MGGLTGSARSTCPRRSLRSRLAVLIVGFVACGGVDDEGVFGFAFGLDGADAEVPVVALRAITAISRYSPAFYFDDKHVRRSGSYHLLKYLCEP